MEKRLFLSIVITLTDESYKRSIGRKGYQTDLVS